MKLIKKLKVEKIKGKYQSFGIFFCSYCMKKVKKRIGNGRRDKSCGCKSIKLSVEKHRVHGDTNKNSKCHKLYHVWSNIKTRCLNSKHKSYKDYGGRGIKVCKEWKDSYITFKKWALKNGYKEELQIDRKENDGNYEPSNCRFVTKTQNMRNTRITKLTLEKANVIRSRYKKENIKQIELGEIFKIDQTIISDIINNKIWR